jgi:hypothetical protein
MTGRDYRGQWITEHDQILLGLVILLGSSIHGFVRGIHGFIGGECKPTFVTPAAGKPWSTAAPGPPLCSS